MAEGAPILRIENLTKVFGKLRAVNDVSLDIADQSVTALIGPSGCGKSTLLRSMNRMNETFETCRTEGRVMIDGENILRRDVDPAQIR